MYIFQYVFFLKFKASGDCIRICGRAAWVQMALAPKALTLTHLSCKFKIPREEVTA